MTGFANPLCVETLALACALLDLIYSCLVFLLYTVDLSSIPAGGCAAGPRLTKNLMCSQVTGDRGKIPRPN